LEISFNEEDTALGHINSLSITPPFNISSLKAWLTKVEGIGAKILQLFEYLSANSPMSDSASVALLTDQYPGSTPDEPMAFICLNSVDPLLELKSPDSVHKSSLFPVAVAHI